VEDFGGARVLDRLLMYERRIESSLYRTMAELRKERQARAAAGSGRGLSFGDLPPGGSGVPQHRRNWVRLAQKCCRRQSQV
jgi:hypothetical protein